MARHKALHAVLQLKIWEQEHLPFAHSIVGQQIFFHLLDAFNHGECKSIKVLSLELPFSAAAIRIQLRKLQRGDWITVKPGIADSRQRFVSMSERAKTLIKEYERQATRLARPR